MKLRFLGGTGTVTSSTTGPLEPEKVYVTHDEMLAGDIMRKRINEKFGWDSEAPDLFEEVEI